jgi:D-alanyl-D-alanine carboxypeptidase
VTIDRCAWVPANPSKLQANGTAGTYEPASLKAGPASAEAHLLVVETVRAVVSGWRIRQTVCAALLAPVLVTAVPALPHDVLPGVAPCTANPVERPSRDVAELVDPDVYRHFRSSDMVIVTGSNSRNRAYLHPLAAAPYIRMRNAAVADGLEMAISSGWRSWDRQMRAYRRFQKTGTNLSGDRVPNVAHPSHSRHPSGLALDLRIDDNPDLIPWLEDHAACYGFVATRGDEPWEYQFTGFADDPAPGTAR